MHMTTNNTTQIAQDPRFAWIKDHGGPSIEWDDRPRCSGPLTGFPKGKRWTSTNYSGPDKWLPVHQLFESDGGDAYIKLDPSGPKGSLRWTASKFFSFDKFASADGASATWAEALVAAKASIPRPIRLNGVEWWSNGPESFKTWINGREIRMNRRQHHRDSDLFETPWRWQIDGNSTTAEAGAAAAVSACVGALPGQIQHEQKPMND